MRISYLLIFLCGMSVINMKTNPLSKTAQEKEPDSITLRGQVESVELSNVSASGVSLVIKLKLELLNNGTLPVIFLEAKPPSLVGAALTRRPDPLIPDNTLATDYKGESVNTSPEWILLRNSLNQPSPPPDKVRILMPNESWQLEDCVSIALPTEISANSISFPRSESWERIRELSTVWLRITYQTWSLNLEPLSNDRTKMTFGRKLQKKWKDVGLLWLDGVRSEPIMLDLKKAQSTVDMSRLGSRR
jgi:hypothetical protein